MSIKWLRNQEATLTFSAPLELAYSTFHPATPSELGHSNSLPSNSTSSPRPHKRSILIWGQLECTGRQSINLYLYSLFPTFRYTIPLRTSKFLEKCLHGALLSWTWEISQWLCFSCRERKPGVMSTHWIVILGSSLHQIKHLTPGNMPICFLKTRLYSLKDVIHIFLSHSLIKSYNFVKNSFCPNMFSF